MVKWRLTRLLICIAMGTIGITACNSSADQTTGDDTSGVPSVLDTMNTPLHPGMVDSSGTLRTNKQ